MKTLFIILAFLLLPLNYADKVEEDPQVIMNEMWGEIESSVALFITKYDNLASKRDAVATQLLKPNLTTDEKVELLIAKDALQTELKILSDVLKEDINKIRYTKGLQVIKSLYEKVLALDHHFASVQTFSEINKVSNPNQYPEFAKVKEKLKAKKNSKFSLDLTNLLSNNLYTSVTQTMLTLFGSDLSSKEKENELETIECIMDFTLRMHQDLNTIYFETQYLRAGNESIKKDIENLFGDYTKPIGYLTELGVCRAKDDWSTVGQKLKEYMSQVDAVEGKEKYKKQVDLEFGIDRLLQFVTKYNFFIDQGEKFHEKFAIILTSYENEQQCKSKLPIEYSKLKNDINISIDKFQTAYRPVEINGSKMKELLFGISEFD